MNKLKVNLKNCFGIGKFDEEFDFTTSTTILIYAPNGTMKTSFANTFELIAKDDSKNLPCDRIYNSRVTEFEITKDDVRIEPIKILVVNAEDSYFDASNKVTTFLASKELKKKYDDIYFELNNRKKEFIKKLKVVSKSSDCEVEFTKTFTSEHSESFFELLLNQIKNLKIKFEEIEFRYNDVFDKKGNVKKFLNKHQDILDQYINNYKNLISESRLFKKSTDNSFGTYQVNEIIKSIEDDSFFEAGHKFVLGDGTEINNSEKLKNIVQEEIEKLLQDEELKKIFEKVDKAIGANVELRSFKAIIEKNNLLLVNLSDYEKYRKEVWINYLSQIKEEAEGLSSYYSKKKEELNTLISKAKEESNLWIKITNTFNSRFYVPFKVVIVNQEDVILKQEAANLEFEYFENNTNPVKQKKDELLEILSKGEQRAYYILQLLFEIESRKLSSEYNLLIFDDIADSFDYKNKYAIIEYLKDLHHSSNFRSIILTHNFDFYRTVASRLELPGNSVFMTTKSDNKEIKLHRGEYRKNVFDYFISNFSKPKIFLSLIAFVRNLVEYSESDKCKDYLMLTSCLHIKENTNSILVGEILDTYKNRLVKLKDKSIKFGEKKYIEFIYKVAQEITEEMDINEILLENKIVLAIAIRLKAEEYMISRLNNLDLTEISSNQTKFLYEKYCNANKESQALPILDKVNLITPENIHINAFMYEPLIDMSIYHLKKLYCDVKKLTD